MSEDDKATARLRGLIERPEKVTFWGQAYTITPQLIAHKFGDGKNLVVITPLATRPNYFVVRIDSSVKDVRDYWPEGNQVSLLDDIMLEAEHEYGYYDDEDTPDDERHFPIVDWGVGTCFSAPFPLPEWKPTPWRNHIRMSNSKRPLDRWTRIELIDEISRRANVQYTWFVNVDDSDHPDINGTFCRDHARMVARIESQLHAVDTVTEFSMNETDSAERCAFYGCQQALSDGGLTNHGVNSALGLTESDPKNTSVHIEELELAARAMSDDDERWLLWMHHARCTLQRQREANR